MKVQKHYALVLVALLATLLLTLSACSPTATGGSSSLSPADVLQKSVTAMKDVKSAHMAITSTDSVKNTQDGGVTSSIAVNVTGKGDAQLPDEQFSLKLNPTNVSLAEIIKGDKVYVQNTKGQWYVLDKNVFESAAGNMDPFAGFSFTQSDLLGLLGNMQIVDHGDETLNGTAVRHITANLDKTALKQLLQTYPQVKSVLGDTNLDAVLDKTKTFQSSMDVWIDTTHYYLNRTQLKVNLTADVTGLSTSLTPTPSSGSAKTTTAALVLDSTIDLSNFNVPVTITPPTNATPTSDPTVIFGSLAQ